MGPDTLIASLGPSLAAMLGRRAGDIDVQPWTVGGNNRVFLVRSGTMTAVAKWYYSEASDRRDRLQAEWSFLKYARAAGLNEVPAPIACDPEKHLALYEYIEGRKLAAPEIDRQRIEQAASFFRRLNAPAARLAANELGMASEACFSIADHFTLVDGRIARLGSFAAELEVDREAAAFIGRLGDAWAHVKCEIAASAARLSLPLAAVLEPGDRCVSPSDFGFHNILARADGSLCFIDFEYAGIDDPAKMACDFFCQPAVPVDPVYFDLFVDAALDGSAKAERMKARIRLLQPVFAIKWCCIMLNVFVPVLASRVQFAAPATDMAIRKREQLEKSKAAFTRIGI